MAYAPRRSMNASLSEGTTDGKYKKVVNNRDGAVEHATYESRKDLHDQWFGIHETPVKVAPDGLLHSTPNYTENPTIPGVDAY